MKQCLRSLVSRFRNRRRYAFADMPSWLLAGLGSLSALEAWYWSRALSGVGEPYVEALNRGRVDLAAGALLGAGVLGLALNTFFFGAIAARCGGLLKDRWFK